MAQEQLCPNIDRKSLIPKRLNYLIVNLVQTVLIMVFLFLLKSVRTLYDTTTEEMNGKCAILSTKKWNEGATEKSERKNEMNKSVYQHIAFSQKDTESNQRNKSVYQHIAFSQKDTESNQIENQVEIETKIKQK